MCVTKTHPLDLSLDQQIPFAEPCAFSPLQKGDKHFEELLVLLSDSGFIHQLSRTLLDKAGGPRSSRTENAVVPKYQKLAFVRSST